MNQCKAWHLHPRLGITREPGAIPAKLGEFLGDQASAEGRKCGRRRRHQDPSRRTGCFSLDSKREKTKDHGAGRGLPETSPALPSLARPPDSSGPAWLRFSLRSVPQPPGGFARLQQGRGQAKSRSRLPCLETGSLLPAHDCRPWANFAPQFVASGFRVSCWEKPFPGAGGVGNASFISKRKKLEFFYFKKNGRICSGGVGPDDRFLGSYLVEKGKVCFETCDHLKTFRAGAICALFIVRPS